MAGSSLYTGLMTAYLRMALRTIRRRKGAYFAAAAILAVGVGMSVAMFSLVDAVLIRPLPFPHQETLRLIWKTNPPAGSQVEELAYPELRDLQENIPDFESVAVLPTTLYGYGRVLQRGAGDPVEIEGSPVSHDFFHVLGIMPAAGRDFSANDERVGAPPVVILSDRLWREQLGADSGILGQTIRLSGESFTVIGVMPPKVEFPRGAGFWIPLGVEQRVVERRGATFLQAIARVRPGRSPQAIAAQVEALFERLAKDHPEVYAPTQRAVITPLTEYWTGAARTHLWIMLAAAVLLLIGAATNAGNLLLSRTAARLDEIATRIALGASRGQIVAQLAAEGTAVAILGSAGGLAIAYAAIQVLTHWAPEGIPRATDASLNYREFAFAVGAATVAALACAVMASWPATRESKRRKAAGSRNAFVVAQSAATAMLLAMAALLTSSYHSIVSEDTGFANRDALTMNLALRGPGLFAGSAFDRKSRETFYARLLTELRSAPGVTSAAAVLVRPLEGTIGWDRSYLFAFERGTTGGRSLPKANYEVVTPGYFATVGTQLLEGRDFDEHDTAEHQPVIIISRALAERIRAAGFTPLGSSVSLEPDDWRKVVGVSADARYRGVTQPLADVFVPALQAAAPTNYVVIRGNRPSQELASLVRRTLAGIDSTQAVSGVATIGQMIDRNAVLHRFNMTLLLWFGICAAILAAAGVHGVVAEAMGARRRELAIKTALGARRSRLVREAVSRTLAWVLVGAVLGIVGTAALGSLAADLLYGVSARDPGILGGAGAFLLMASAASAFGPAWNASGRAADLKQFLRI
jgi:putative ABC transport system permease protein